MTAQCPWRIKIGAKIVLSRLSLSYAFGVILGLFSHKLPIARQKIDSFFSLRSVQRMCVKGFDVLLRPVGDSL